MDDCVLVTFYCFGRTQFHWFTSMQNTSVICFSLFSTTYLYTSDDINERIFFYIFIFISVVQTVLSNRPAGAVGIWSIVYLTCCHRFLYHFNIWRPLSRIQRHHTQHQHDFIRHDDPTWTVSRGMVNGSVLNPIQIITNNHRCALSNLSQCPWGN